MTYLGHEVIHDDIHGGSGTNYLTGGVGQNEITGGSGTNFIYGHGTHDVLQGGTGSNYIAPNTDANCNSLASIQVEGPGTPYYDPNYIPKYENDGQYTHDGNIDSQGNADVGEYEASYGGLWNFSDFDSAYRLGESDVTPVAVYVQRAIDVGWKSSPRRLRSPVSRPTSICSSLRIALADLYAQIFCVAKRSLKSRLIALKSRG